MKVKKRSNGTFEEVEIGGVFVSNGLIFMRLSSITGSEYEYNSVNLENGTLEFFNYNESVMIYPEAELII
jgi:hypothetical protein